MNLVHELELKGMEYKNAFKVANLMETEGISQKEAQRRVAQEVTKEEEFKVKDQVPEGAGVPTEEQLGTSKKKK